MVDKHGETHYRNHDRLHADWDGLYSGWTVNEDLLRCIRFELGRAILVSQGVGTIEKNSIPIEKDSMRIAKYSANMPHSIELVCNESSSPANMLTRVSFYRQQIIDGGPPENW